MLTEPSRNHRNLCIVKDAGIMEDDRDELKKYILQLLQSTDILITSGGVSMGSRDYIKPILEEIGDIKFEDAVLNLVNQQLLQQLWLQIAMVIIKMY